jgi:hypothetical protein
MGTYNLRHALDKTQQEVLHEAMAELGLTRPAFAARIGAPWETFRKWMLPQDAGGVREMPSIAWAMVNEVLEHERLKKSIKPTKKKMKESA